MPTGSAYYLIIAFSVTLLSQLGGNKYHSTKICESCLTCMLVAMRSECEFVRKFPLKYSRGQTEMRMLSRMMGMKSIENIRTEEIRAKVCVANISEKIREARLIWLVHIVRNTGD